MNIKNEGILHIGCFGAIRNLKNHVNQALASIRTADYHDLTLYFHVNATRSEGPGSESLLKNLRAIFKDTDHTLVEHPWLKHKELLELMPTMDILVQASLTETFNITCADAVITGVPVVASAQVDWLHNSYSKVPNPNDMTDIFLALNQILTLEPEKYEKLLDQQLISLNKYNDKSREIWLAWVYKDKQQNF